MLNKAFGELDRWVVRSVIWPGDDQETLLRKKILWGLLLCWIFFNMLDIISALSIDMMAVVVADSIDLCLCMGLLLTFYFYRRKVELFGLILQLMIILFPITKVYILGGVFEATGVAVAGLIGPIYALTFPKYRKAIGIFLLYLTLLVGVTLLRAYQADRAFLQDFTITYRLIRLSGGLVAMFSISLIYSVQLAKLKRLEEERLVQLHHTKSKLYSNITHEFRTPLTVILGMADKLEEDPKNMLTKSVRLIKSNGFKLLKLVNQLLTMSKMEAESLKIKMIQTDIIPFLKYAIESFHSVAETKNIRLHFLNEPESLTVDFDPAVMEDILSNLVSNAIKFTPGGGDVYVQLESPIFSEDSKRYILIKVRDNGCGIEESKLPRIFDRFYQADDESTRKAEGTGIGLSLVKEYISLLKGTINVKSQPGKGTEFILKLPVTHDAPAEKPGAYNKTQKAWTYGEHRVFEDPMPEVDAPASDDQPLLLIVEDNQDVVEYLRSVLNDRYQIDVARDGILGIEKALQVIPDLIVCDIMMPEKDGYEVCKTLKSDFRTNHIPIIMLTAKADIDSKINGLEFGADAYMIKPFNKRELLVRIDNLIENRQVLKNKFSDVTSSSFMKTKPEGLNEIFLHSLLDNLEKNFQDEQYTIDQLCVDTAVSRAQLHRKLVAITGKSTSDFIRTFRINKARELLVNPNLTISEIAYQVGFKDPNYFTKSFTRDTGKTPSQFRNENLIMKD